MSAVPVPANDKALAAAAAIDGGREEAARLGFRLTLPAQILVLFIAAFPLLMQLYICAHRLGAADGDRLVGCLGAVERLCQLQRPRP